LGSASNANASPTRSTPNQASANYGAAPHHGGPSNHSAAPNHGAQPHHGRSSMPDGKSNGKAGAHWSDEYKRRMQADMDALASR